MKFLKQYIQKSKIIKANNKVIARLSNHVNMYEFSTLKTEVIYGTNDKKRKDFAWVAHYKLSAIDILAIYNSYIKCGNRYEKLVMAKLLCSNSYEFLKDWKHYLGKNLQEQVETYESAELLTYLNYLRSLVNTIDKNFSLLQLIRNKIGSHKDKDFLLQIQVQNSINFSEVEALMVSIYALIVSLQIFEDLFLMSVKYYADSINFIPKEL